MLERALELGAIVGFDHDGEAETHRKLMEVGEDHVVGNGGDDQQCRVGSDGARLEHLDLVDDEVLAEDRERAGGAGTLQVVDRSAEERAIGEHGEASRPTLGVSLGGRRRIEIRRQLALRRRAALDLRHHGEPLVLRAQGSHEVACGRGLECL